MNNIPLEQLENQKHDISLHRSAMIFVLWEAKRAIVWNFNVAVEGEDYKLANHLAVQYRSSDLAYEIACDAAKPHPTQNIYAITAIVKPN